jgi:hypothetical protein
MARFTESLASSRLGRIALHVAAAVADREFAWHFAGIKREIF